MNSLSLVFLFQIFYSFILLWGILFQLFLKRTQVITLSLLLFSIYIIEVFSTYRTGILLFFAYSLLKSFLVYTNYKNSLVAVLSSITTYTLLLGISFLSLDVPRIIFDFEVNSKSLTFYLFMFFGGVLLVILCLIFRYFIKVTNLANAFASLEKKYTVPSSIILLTFYSIALFHHIFMYPMYIYSFLFSFIVLILCGTFSATIIYWFILSYKNSKELQNLIHSLNSIKNEYETTLEFRHDYKNIIRSITGYLNDNDLLAAKEYINELTKYSSTILIPEFYYQLEKIKILPIQSVLASFGEDMYSANTPFTITVKNELTQLDVDTIDIVRCLSILLTNAKEEAVQQDNGRIEVTISSSENNIIFLIRNTLSAPISLSLISKKGFTTKLGHQGKGLSILKKIVSRYKNFDYALQSESELYAASLEIRNTEL